MKMTINEMNAQITENAKEIKEMVRFIKYKRKDRAEVLELRVKHFEDVINYMKSAMTGKNKDQVTSLYKRSEIFKRNIERLAQ